MRQVRVQPDPPVIAAAIKAGDVVVILVRHLAIDAQITLAAELDGCRAHVDADALTRAAAEPPQFAGRESRGSNCCLRRSADRKRRWQHRLDTREIDGA